MSVGHCFGRLDTLPTFRAGVCGEKTKWSQHIEIDVYIYGEESARLPVHAILKKQRVGSMTRPFFAFANTPLVLPRDWVRLSHESSPSLPLKHTPYKKSTPFDFYHDFGPQKTSAEKLASANELLVKAHRELALAADTLKQMQASLEAHKKDGLTGPRLRQTNPEMLPKKVSKKEYAIAK